LRDREKVDFKMTSTGAMDATRVLVMTHQIDAGYILPPFGLDAAEKGEIRIIFAGDEIESMRNITNRVIVAPSCCRQILADTRPVHRLVLRESSRSIEMVRKSEQRKRRRGTKGNNVLFPQGACVRSAPKLR
jgi:hypothetical protein